MDEIRSSMHDVFNQWLDNFVMEKKLNKNRIDLIHQLQSQDDGSVNLKELQFIDFSSLDDYEDNAAEDMELMPLYVEYYQLRRFLHRVADKVIAVDPLDRPLWSPQTTTKIENSSEVEEDITYVDHATKVSDAKQMMQDLEPADGRNFSAPLDQLRYDKLTKLFEQEISRIRTILTRKINDIIA